MITSQKTSLLVPSQLPAFIREEPSYSNFVAFIQAYYEWLEQESNALNQSKNIPNYFDIDATTEQFMQYFINEFLPYFPEDALIDKNTAIKVARQLYESKGTPASYQFLFRLLYNSDFDLFYTKDAVLRASDGVWYVARSLRLSSTDNNWLKTKNYRIFGEETKTVAVIENAVLTTTKIEVFISNIERLFQSGEFVRVVDSHNQDVLFNGQPLRAKIVGQISQIKIDPQNRGLLYNTGDPVVLYGGLNANTANPVGASAVVGQTTAGSITSLSVVQGGWGYRLNPYTSINIYGGGGATAYVAGVNPAAANVASVTFAPIDTIGLKKDITIGASNYNFSNITVSNVHTTFANAFTYAGFTTYPISSLILTNNGSGIRTLPVVDAESIFTNDVGQNAFVKSLGILAPIQIVSGGSGYNANETITISGGTGTGAYAEVTSVDTNGGITGVSYVYGPQGSIYPLGGMGYNKNYMPNLTVNSANTHTSNAAVLYVPTILGDGASFSVTVDRAGAISIINVTNFGEDYVSAPNISLKVQDIVVSNVSLSMVPQKGDVAYQGSSKATATYLATVDSTFVLQGNSDPNKILYNLRTFDYNSIPDPNQPIKIDGKSISAQISNQSYVLNQFYDGSPIYTNGIKTYGDGNARAFATFLNGLNISQGQYLNTRGQPSSYSVLQNQIYNNFTYQITVEKEIAKYRNILLNLLHPSGMKVLGRYRMESSNNFSTTGSHLVEQGYSLGYRTGSPSSSAEMVANFTNKSSNVIELLNLNSANIATFITTNTIIELVSPNGPNVRSQITSVDSVANTVTIQDYVWLTYSNVAVVQANSSENTIKVEYLTGSYDIINNGKYTDVNYPLKDIVHAGDIVKIDNNNLNTVTSVDYTQNIIYVANTINTTVTSYLSVNKTISTTNVNLYGSLDP